MKQKLFTGYKASSIQQKQKVESQNIENHGKKIIHRDTNNEGIKGRQTSIFIPWKEEVR